MSCRALVRDQVHLLSRKNPETGRDETTTYVGSLRNKPKGWTVVKFLGRAMGTESGTC